MKTSTNIFLAESIRDSTEAGLRRGASYAVKVIKASELLKGAESLVLFIYLFVCFIVFIFNVK